MDEAVDGKTSYSSQIFLLDDCCLVDVVERFPVVVVVVVVPVPDTEDGVTSAPRKIDKETEKKEYPKHNKTLSNKPPDKTRYWSCWHGESRVIFQRS